MELQVQVSEALARSNIYGFLSRVTRAEVDAALLAEFRQPEVMHAMQEVGADLWLALAATDDASLLEHLSLAYASLFLFGVNPHGSVNRGEGQLWGESTVAANEFLAEAGLAVEGDTSLLPDHIAMELAVMQHLAAEEAAALSAGNLARTAEVRALQVRYLQEHLGVWGMAFFAQAEEKATHAFYRLMARLGKEFLALEAP
ncbi:MAG: putative component of anaerobic dehydrogenase [Symbiobacteriaceae bacterium]|jgi:TorA maturation chaperone TorD|nr:putative component of anaerobic dehydrogenase [Symbiobacteriaceae bacterium]